MEITIKKTFTITDEQLDDITKVIDKCSAPPRHVGSSPTVRYVVDIAGNRRELYHEGNRWFVEKLIP